jgi:hypothetical protein
MHGDDNARVAYLGPGAKIEDTDGPARAGCVIIEHKGTRALAHSQITHQARPRFRGRGDSTTPRMLPISLPGLFEKSEDVRCSFVTGGHR